MKITLIRPYFGDAAHEPPLGISLIASYLENKGYSVSIIDCEVLNLKSENKIKEKIKEENPDIVGVSFFTYDRFAAIKVANAAKALDILVIGGGLHITFDPVNTLKSIPSIDIGVLGEGEETMAELVKAIENKYPLNTVKGIAFRDNREIILTPPRPFISDLDSLPLPAYHLLPMDLYMYHAVLGSRGCPYNCIFCASPQFWKRKVRYRSYKSFVDEVEYLVKNYGEKYFDFKDDIFFFNKEWTASICKELISRNIKIKWDCLGRANVRDEALFKLMKKAGCDRIRFGVESGNERILNVIKKKITKEDVRLAVKMAKKIGLGTVGTLFMIGHPTETKENMEDTYQFSIELNAPYYSFKPTDIYPGTALFDLAVKEGLLPNNFDWFEKGKYKAGFLTYDDIPSYETSQFSRKLLEATARRFYTRAFFNRAFNLGSLSEFRDCINHCIVPPPATKEDVTILLKEVIRELRIKRTLRKRVIGGFVPLFLTVKIFRRVRERIKSEVVKRRERLV